MSVGWQRPRERAGWVALAALVALGLLFVLRPASAPAAGGSTDFGDAADGSQYGFAKKKGDRPSGFFPSLAATPGPSHSPVGSFFLGAAVDGEADSAQVDEDLFDDGVEADLTPCQPSNLELALNAGGLPAATRTSAHTAYVNAWFDWNGDGDWADPSDGCAPEWTVQNLPVQMGALSADPIAVLPVELDAGRRVDEIWMRVTLTLDEPVVDPTGLGPAGAYTEGETEDYLLPARKQARILKRKPKKPPPPKRNGPFSISCNPNPAVILHGTKAKVGFSIRDFGSGFITGKVTGSSKGLKLNPTKPQPKNVPNGFKAISGFTYTDKDVDPPIRVVKKSFSFSFSRAGRSQRLKCGVAIVHLDSLLPPFVCRDNPCAGELQPVPPAPGGPGGLNGGWVPIPIEIVQLQLQSVQPVVEFSLPLLGQQPPWPEASLVLSNDPTVDCGLGTLREGGGPAALNCRRANQPLNNVYQVRAGVLPEQGQPVNGEVTIGGQRLSFALPQQP